MPKSEVKLRVGKYRVDRYAWFDIRLCDGGVMLSLFDDKSATRFTVIVDGGKVVEKEAMPIDTKEPPPPSLGDPIVIRLPPVRPSIRPDAPTTPVSEAERRQAIRRLRVTRDAEALLRLLGVAPPRKRRAHRSKRRKRKG
jgi:hypothetical protein